MFEFLEFVFGEAGSFRKLRGAGLYQLGENLAEFGVFFDDSGEECGLGPAIGIF